MNPDELMKLATVGRAKDGTWSALSIPPDGSVVLGMGKTKEAALEGLRSGIDLFMEDWAERQH